MLFSEAILQHKPSHKMWQVILLMGTVSSIFPQHMVPTLNPLSHLYSQSYSITQSLLPFTQLRLRQGLNKERSLLRTCVALVSSCFSEAWTETIEITITDSFSFSLRKLVYCKQQSPRRILGIRIVNYPFLTLPYLLFITITSISYQ